MKYIIRLRSSLPFRALTAPDFLSLSYARSLVTSSLAFYFFDRILHLRSPRLSSHRYFSQLHLRCESRLKIIRIRFSIRIGRAASRRPDYDFAKSMKGKREKGNGKPQARKSTFHETEIFTAARFVLRNEKQRAQCKIKPSLHLKFSF